MSVNIGWEGGVYAQSCGHYLHLDCHKSYIDALSVCLLATCRCDLCSTLS